MYDVYMNTVQTKTAAQSTETRTLATIMEELSQQEMREGCEHLGGPELHDDSYTHDRVYAYDATHALIRMGRGLAIVPRRDI